MTWKRGSLLAMMLLLTPRASQPSIYVYKYIYIHIYVYVNTYVLDILYIYYVYVNTYVLDILYIYTHIYMYLWCTGLGSTRPRRT